ncbi:MAG: UDP-N-acetylmuramate dehydrogenase [Bacteroidota bacterium]
MHIQHHVSLKPYHTFGIESKAKRFANFGSTKELIKLLELAQSSKYLIIGGGSNIVFTKDFDGCILRNCIQGKEMIDEQGDEVLVQVGAGESWHAFVLWCLAQNYGGIENLSLIPGTVGAAPIQNIGAYGVELKDVFESLTALDVQQGKMITFDKAACQFGYRESIFKQQKGRYIITSVKLRLRKQNHQLNTSYGAIQKILQQKGITKPSIKAISQSVIHIRSSKLPDPAQIGNAGSFFKNPVVSNTFFEQLQGNFPSIIGYPQGAAHTKVPAGWLIEQTGWKGKRKGQVGCYAQQALVLVNLGGATGQGVLELVQTIQAAVQRRFGIELSPEVNLV